MKKDVIKATYTLMGCIIGAGVLGIPYVVSKAGFLVGLIDIIVLGIVILFINLFMGEVVLRTQGNHQLTGYAEKYLGRKGKKIMTLGMVIGIYGALLAYIIGVGEALSVILGIHPFLSSLLFFVFASYLIYKGIGAIGESEMLLGSCVLILILTISGISIFSNHFDISNLGYTNFKNILLPYGVILFAFLGTAAIPEMKEEMTRDRNHMRNSIIIGTLAVIFLYLLFAFAVIGVSGVKITEIATIGLGELFGYKMIVFANLFAIFAMTTSCLALGLALKEAYSYDYHINKFFSWIMTCSVPLIIFLLGARSFIKTIGIVGTFAGGIECMLVVLMLWNAKKKGNRRPEYSMKFTKIIGFILILIFIYGIVDQILGLI